MVMLGTMQDVTALAALATKHLQASRGCMQMQSCNGAGHFWHDPVETPIGGQYGGQSAIQHASQDDSEICSGAPFAVGGHQLCPATSMRV